MQFVDEQELDYRPQALTAADAPLRLDRAYCLHHLPIVNAAHPDVIGRDSENGITAGRFATPRRSLVAFVDWGALAASDTLIAVLEQLRAASFGPKIAWRHFARRQDRLHFTITSLPPEMDADACADAVQAGGPYAVSIGSVWAGGRRNTGRLYLPCRPNIGTDGVNALHGVQQCLGMPLRGFYGIGLLNFTDHLDNDETHELIGIVDANRNATVTEMPLTGFTVIDTFDSLLMAYARQRDIAVGVDRNR